MGRGFGFGGDEDPDEIYPVGHLPQGAEANKVVLSRAAQGILVQNPQLKEGGAAQARALLEVALHLHQENEIKVNAKMTRIVGLMEDKESQQREIELATNLMKCVQKGDEAGCREHVRNGADASLVYQHLNGFMGGGSRADALMVAADKGHPNIIKFLVEDCGAQVNPPSGPSLTGPTLTALLIAARAGHAEACRALLEHGADVTYVAGHGHSAFHFAADSRAPGRMDVCRVLCEHGGDINQKKSMGHDNATALIHAAHHGDAELCKVMIELGADPLFVSESTSHGHHDGNVLHVAFHNYWRGGDDEAKKTEEDRNLELIKVLLATAVDPRQKNKQGETPLVRLANCQNYHQYDKCLPLLLLAIARRELKDDNDQATGVPEDSWEGDPMPLLEQPQTQAALRPHWMAYQHDRDDYTPLAIAVREGRDDLVALFVKYGAPVSDKPVYLASIPPDGHGRGLKVTRDPAVFCLLLNTWIAQYRQSNEGNSDEDAKSAIIETFNEYDLRTMRDQMESRHVSAAMKKKIALYGFDTAPSKKKKAVPKKAAPKKAEPKKSNRR